MTTIARPAQGFLILLILDEGEEGAHRFSHPPRVGNPSRFLRVGPLASGVPFNDLFQNNGRERVGCVIPCQTHQAASDKILQWEKGEDAQN